MNKPRCSRHKDEAKLPTLCSTCQRINVEQKIVKATVNALLNAGYTLNVDNGGDEPELQTPTADPKVILGVLMEVDDEHLLVYEAATDPRATGWVRFVYGNDGYDVISDYTIGLEDVLKGVNEYARTFEPA